MLCRGDRVIPFPIKGLSWKDNPDLAHWFERTLKSLKIATDKDGWIIPNPAIYQSYEEMADAIVKESEEKPLNLRGFDDFELSMKRAGRDLQIVLIAKENAGEPINRAASKVGDFNKPLVAMLTEIIWTDCDYSSLKRIAQPSAPLIWASTILTAASMG